MDDHVVTSKEEIITPETVTDDGLPVTWADEEWVIKCSCGWMDHAHSEGDVDQLFLYHLRHTA